MRPCTNDAQNSGRLPKTKPCCRGGDSETNGDEQKMPVFSPQTLHLTRASYGRNMHLGPCS